MSSVSELEEHLVTAKEYADRRRMAVRLANNRDFKKLILEEFCVQECARYAQNSANPQFSKEERADSLAIAQAAGHLRRFLQVINQMGAKAESDIAAIEEAIEEARLEEARAAVSADEAAAEDEAIYEGDAA